MTEEITIPLAEILVWEGHLPKNKHLQKLLAQHKDKMMFVAEEAKAGMDVLSKMHGYASFKVVQTLATAQLFERAACLSEDEQADGEAAFDLFTKMYLQRIVQLLEAEDKKIVRLVVGESS